MKTEKFENGMSIVQLEERFEMLAAEGDRTVNIDTTITPTSVSVGTHFNF